MASFCKATVQDMDDRLPIMRRYDQEEGYLGNEATLRSALLDLIQNDSLGCFWVIQKKAPHAYLVGYLAVTLGFSLEYQGRDACVDELSILEAFRGQGQGLGWAAL